MTNPEQDLNSIRSQIDAIDQEILTLINERALLVLAIAKIKIKEQGADAEFFCPEREAQILKKIISRNQGPLSAKSVMNIFQQIMTHCRALESTDHTKFKP